MTLLTVTLIISAYLIGSISSAVLIAKLAGLPDPRIQGSKNPGATNVLRLGGKKLAILVLVFDVLKGVIPVLLGKLMGLETLTLAVIGIAAFLGHLYPVFFRFQGGKGVATLLGVVIALNSFLALMAIAIWLIMAMLFRYSSLASLTSCIVTPFCAYWLGEHALIAPLALMSLLLLMRHRTNLQRLFAGSENKLF